MPRLIVLGCGTGVGKTRVSVALLAELARRGHPALGLKPVETGLAEPQQPGSDAFALSRAGSVAAPAEHPLYALPEPVSPHLAARSQGVTIETPRIADWVRNAEFGVAPYEGPHSALWTIVETAGGVFSPLADEATNFELAQELEPATWLLVATDALGVLHDVSATLQAMAARGRTPNHVVLSGAREADASTGRNAAELARLGIASISAVLARNDDRGVGTLVDRLLAGERS